MNQLGGRWSHRNRVIARGWLCTLWPSAFTECMPRRDRHRRPHRALPAAHRLMGQPFWSAFPGGLVDVRQTGKVSDLVVEAGSLNACRRPGPVTLFWTPETLETRTVAGDHDRV